MSTPTIRLATLTDCEAINDIYNYFVLHCTCTYQTQIEPIETRRAWFTARSPAHPVIVAELDGIIVGWGALSRFHPREAYARTVEISVYVDHLKQGRGIGRVMMADLTDRARSLNHHTIIALISAEQQGSITLHEKFGFAKSGHLREAGFKFGRWLDVLYLQKML